MEAEIDPKEGLGRLGEVLVYECERRKHGLTREAYTCLMLVGAVRSLQAASFGQGQMLAGMLREQAMASQRREAKVQAKREQRSRIITLDKARRR